MPTWTNLKTLDRAAARESAVVRSARPSTPGVPGGASLRGLGSFRTLSRCVTAALPLAFVGCAELDADVRFEGELTWGACEARILPWEPSFATLDMLPDGTGMLRFQDEPGALRDDDVLVVRIPAARLTLQPLPVTVEIGREGPGATGELVFPDRCPDQSAISAKLVGTIRFDRVGFADGERIEGTLAVRVEDGRDPTVVLGESLQGDFRFVFRDDPPWQTFAAQ